MADATEGVLDVPSTPAKQRSCPPVLDKAGDNEAVVYIEKGTLSFPKETGPLTWPLAVRE